MNYITTNLKTTTTTTKIRFNSTLTEANGTHNGYKFNVVQARSGKWIGTIHNSDDDIYSRHMAPMCETAGEAVDTAYRKMMASR